MKNNFYTYIYLDPRKPGRYCYNSTCTLYEPIYVGKGCGKRYLDHLKFLDTKKSDHFRNKILKILASSLKDFDIKNYILVFRNSLLEKEAFELERQLIKEIGRSDLRLGPLTNHTDGGDGASGLVHCEETKEKMRQAKLGRKLSLGAKEKLRRVNLGRKHSIETKEKISRINLGKKLSEKAKEKITRALLGRECSEETRKRISEANQGKKRSEEAKQRISEVQLGKKLSEEHKKKISESNVGKHSEPRSEEWNEKNRQAQLGKKLSKETRERMSQAHLGQPGIMLGKRHSEETKKRMSQSRLGRKCSEETKEKIRQTKLANKRVYGYAIRKESIYSDRNDL